MRSEEAKSLNLGGRLVELSQPVVMGILNVTPDSFYAQSRTQTESDIARRAEQILSEGGTLVDVGACSTRPGSQPVGEEEETERLVKAIKVVRWVAPEAPVSTDTFRARVAERIAGDFGPVIVNDVTGGQDPDMFPLVARLGLPYVLTDTGNSPLSMPFAQALSQLRELGQRDIIADPGFGFGKTLDENYQVMAQLQAYRELDQPLLVGVSRKSMVYKLLGTTPDEALNGTTVLHTVALMAGAHILRVHDVRAAVEAIRIVEKVNGKW